MRRDGGGGKDECGGCREGGDGSERHCSVAQVFFNVEDEVTRALQELKVAVGATAAATCALSCGTGARYGDTAEEGAYEVAIETWRKRKEEEKMFWQWTG